MLTARPPKSRPRQLITKPQQLLRTLQNPQSGTTGSQRRRPITKPEYTAEPHQLFRDPRNRYRPSRSRRPRSDCPAEVLARAQPKGMQRVAGPAAGSPACRINGVSILSRPLAQATSHAGDAAARPPTYRKGASGTDLPSTPAAARPHTSSPRAVCGPTSERQHSCTPSCRGGCPQCPPRHARRSQPSGD